MRKVICLILCVCLVCISTHYVYADDFYKINLAINNEVITTFQEALSIEDASDITPSNTFITDVTFWDDNGYSEYIISDTDILGVDVKIKNNSEESQIVYPYVALYEDGRLVESKAMLSQSINAGEDIEYSDSFVIDSNNADSYTIKVFNWKSNLQPLSNAVAIVGEKTDFYGNSMNEATLIHNTQKVTVGAINSSDDVDFLKIIPQATNTYLFNSLSADGVTMTIYDSSGTALINNTASFEYSLVKEKVYYISLSNSGSTGNYIFSIKDNLAGEAQTFDIYKFDEDMNIYKNSILEICNDLYYEDKSLAKEMYSEYEMILDDDAELHVLPDFLSDHPKDLSNFDDLLNQYYSIKYEEFDEIKQRYISLIDKYTELASDANANNTEAVNTIQHTASEDIPGAIIVTAMAQEIKRNGLGTEIIQPGDDIQQTPATPSLTIVNTTETSITYNVVFPVSGQWGNAVYMIDFNADDGLTVCQNIYGSDVYRRNGQYTVSGLSPGGIYILEILWSTDGELYGGENSIHRFVQLPDNTEEVLTLYSGGRVTARMEQSDKELASSADFNTWLNRMDQVYNAYKELTGYTPYDSKKIEMKSTRDNLNDYMGITDGHNYWQAALGYYDYTNVFKHSRTFYQGHMRRLSQGDWGDTPIHEMSHVFDNDKWLFDEETLAQFKLYYVVEQLNAKVYNPARFTNESQGWYTGENYYYLLRYDRYFDSYTVSFDNGAYAPEGFAVILIDIQREIGWEPFKKTFRYFNSLPEAQIFEDEGEILKLFLTKLKDFSGEDVLSMISNRDTNIIEDWYGVDLEYVESFFPALLGDGVSGVGSSEITVSKGSYSIFQFTPTESANYYIYTSPYGGSGVSNDTYIEVYDNASLSGTPLASNDDYDGGRFSKVSVAMTEGATYYIKITHYNNGHLHAELNITKNVPVVELPLDEYKDVRVAKGEFALYSYTPTKSITHVFEVGNYNGGTTEYDTYIKLYGNESMTQRIGHGNNKIIVNLDSGHTYYLQFSGFLMKSSRGRISVREGQTIEFSKSTDSSFIYVNSPEYITRIDIVDDPCHTEPLSKDYGVQEYIKIFEQENITGKNTLYETHTAWWGELGAVFNPLERFYMDIDMYNPTANPITVSIENLAYGVDYSVLQQYYTGGYDFDITIEPYSHVPIFSYLGAPLLCEEKSSAEWARIPVILFDFTVHSGNITVSTVAAYDSDNLYLRNGTANVVDAIGAELNSGDVILALDDNNNAAWGTLDDPRRNETDLYAKMKGIARNESAWIDANIELSIDENTLLGANIPIYLKDDYYNYGISNPKWSWKSSINPLNDKWDSVLMALPSGLHNFKYHYGDTDREWNFDFWHRDLRYMNINGSTSSVNDEVPYEIRDNAKLDMAAGQKLHFDQEEAPDEYSMSMGEWGATYHYTITVNNTTDRDRVVCVNTWSAENMIFGLKEQGENSYTTTYYSKIYNTPDNPTKAALVNVPRNTTISFEFVTLLGGGLGGLNHAIVVE